jgi:protein CpxP
MKKLGILFFMLVMAATSMAQGFGGGQQMTPEERAKQQTAQIKEAVGLNADQEKKVLDLNVEQGKKQSKMFEEMQGGGGDMEGMREKMTAMREETNKKMKEILTAEQWTKYEKWQEERRSRFGGGGPRN